MKFAKFLIRKLHEPLFLIYGLGFNLIYIILDSFTDPPYLTYIVE